MCITIILSYSYVYVFLSLSIYIYINIHTYAGSTSDRCHERSSSPRRRPGEPGAATYMDVHLFIYIERER